MLEIVKQSISFHGTNYFIIDHTNKRLEAQMMKNVKLTRKERMVMEREKNAKARKRSIQRYAFVGSVATGIILSANSESVFACSDTYIVQNGDNLYSLAKKYNVSVEQIQGVNNLSSEMIKAGQTLEVPALVGTHTEHEKQNHTENGENITHKVQRGDTLFSLAKKYDVSIEQIQQGNGLTSETIKVAQVLKIKSPKVVKATNQATELHKEINKEIHNEKMTFATYTVAAGETLWGIARQFNLSIADLKTYNHLTNDMVLIGQKLIINPSNLTKTTATVVGAADNFTVEFIINGEPTTMQVAYGTAQNFGNISGEKVELVYYNSPNPRLVSIKNAEAQNDEVVL